MVKRTFFSLVCISVLISSCFTLRAQQYCQPSYTGAQFPDPFFTYIKEVQVSNLSNVLTSDNAANGFYYRDFRSSDTAVLARTGSYELTIQLGNGANDQTARAWVDFNQNQLFEPSERLFTQIDQANQGDHRYKFTFKVPSYATLGNTAMRIGTRVDTIAPNPCRNSRGAAFFMNFHDYTVDIKKPQLQRIISITPFDAGPGVLAKRSKDQKVLRVEMKTNPAGILNPLTLDSSLLDAHGSDRIKDISKVRFYHTSTLKELDNEVPTDSINQPSSSSFNLKSGKPLKPGNNYGWLTYDVDSHAVFGNRLNARAIKLYSGKTYTTQIQDPAPYKTISYCKTKGINNGFVFIDSLSIHNISNLTGPNADGYGYYDTFNDTLWAGNSYSVSVRVGNGANTCFVVGWIDFNGNGIFDQPSEEMFNRFYNGGGNVLLQGSFFVPNNIDIGNTRLRISAQYSNSAFNSNLEPDPCDNPLKFGESEDYKLYLSDVNQAIADFDASSVCLGDTVHFNEQSYVSSGSDSITSYDWTFGDGQNSSAKNPDHYYNSAGFYNVKLVVKSSSGDKDSVIKPVRVEKLNLGFSVSDSVAGHDLSFIDNTTGGQIISRKWHFGDTTNPVNDTASGVNPVYQYDSAGTYNVQLKVESQGGCIDSITKSINIQQYKFPEAYFRLPKDTFFQLETVNLYNQSRYQKNHYWKVSTKFFQFVNGTDSSSQAPELSFDSTGQFEIRLFAENPLGIDTFERQITIIEPIRPVAKVSVNDSSIHAGKTISFRDLSLNNPQSWKWYFGDGDSSSQEHPSHYYSDTGTYDVTLIVSNAGGTDTIVRENWIEVHDRFRLCEQGTTETDLFSGTIFDVGGPNGDYYESNSCGFTINPSCPGKIMLVFDNFDIDPSDNLQVYDGIDASGEPLHPGNGFNNDAIPDTVVAESGAIFIEFNTDFADEGAGFEARWISGPNPIPQPSIKYDSPVYVNHPVNFKPHSPGARNSYRWDFTNDGQWDASGNGSFTHNYPDTGNYTVKIEGSNCSGTDSAFHDIHVVEPTQPPKAVFNIDTQTVSLFQTITLRDSSLYGPTNWEWIISPRLNSSNPNFPFNYSFINGTSETSVNPMLAFLAPGYYDVCHVVENQLGRDTVCKQDFINVLDEATMCDDDSLSSQNGLLIDDGGMGGEYSKGDSVCSMVINPCASKLYLVTDSFDVWFSDSLRIYDGVDASGTPLFINDGFNNSNPPPDTLVAHSGSFYIEFSTGNQFTPPAQGFVFEWFIDSFKADFSVQKDLCPNEKVWAKNQSPTFSSSKWYVKGSEISNRDSIQFSFLNPGQKTLSLSIEGSYGCRDTITKDLIVHHKPTADFSIPNALCDKDTMTFMDQSQVSNGQIQNLQWKINDIAVGQDSVLNYRYDSSGSYKTSLIAESNWGCLDTMDRSIMINEKPVADFSIEDQCTPDSILLTDITQSTSSIQNRQWSWGQGQVNDSAEIVLQPVNPGKYFVGLKVKDSMGCQDSLEKPVYFNPGILTRFTVEDTCQNTVLSVNNMTDTGIVGVEKYQWHLNNDTVTGKEPAITPEQDGMQRLRLFTHSIAGCVDTFSRQVEIFPQPDLPYSIKGSLCAEDSVRLIDSVSITQGSIAEISWNIKGNVFTGDGRDTFQVATPQPGVYPFTLKAVSSIGCGITIHDSIKVNPLPDAGFTYQQQQGEATFNANDTNHINYRWEFPDSTIQDSVSFTYHFAENGTYPVSLFVEDSSGCKNSITNNVQIQGVGIEQSFNEASIQTYPNPFENSITIEFHEFNKQGSPTLQIQTLTGKILSTKEIEANEKEIYWNLKELPAGSYFLSIRQDNAPPAVRKIIIKQ